MNHRQNEVFVDVNSDPDFAAAHRVYVTPVGGFIKGFTANNPGSTLQVDEGHSIQPGDRLLIAPATDNQQFTVPVDSVTATGATWNNQVYVAGVGDLAVNLGPDGNPGTGPTITPNYDSSPVQIFDDMGGLIPFANPLVSCDEFGNYDYWHLLDGRVWEVILDPNNIVRAVIPGYSAGTGRRVNIWDYGLGNQRAGNLTGMDRWPSAVLAVPLDGGSIWIPGGTSYNVDDALIIDRGKISIQMEAAGSLINNMPNGETLNLFSVATGVSLSRLSFQGIHAVDNDPANHPGATVFSLDNMIDCYIEVCISEGFENFARINAVNASQADVSIRNCIARGLGGQAVIIEGAQSSQGITVALNYFEGDAGKVSGVAACIQLGENTNRYQVHGNTIENWGASAVNHSHITVAGDTGTVNDNVSEESDIAFSIIATAATNSIVDGNVARDAIDPAATAGTVTIGDNIVV